jgi:hypothetical protein
MPPPRLLRFGGVIANDGSSAVRYIEHRTTKRENDVFSSYGQAKSLSNAEHMGLFLSRNALNLFPSCNCRRPLIQQAGHGPDAAKQAEYVRFLRHTLHVRYFRT